MEILLSVLALLALLLKALFLYQSEKTRTLKELQTKQNTLNQAIDSNLSQMVQKNQNEKQGLHSLQDAMDSEIDVETERLNPNGPS